MPDLKMLNSTKYLYKLTFIKCSYVDAFRLLFLRTFPARIISFSDKILVKTAYLCA